MTSGNVAEPTPKASVVRQACYTQELNVPQNLTPSTKIKPSDGLPGKRKDISLSNSSLVEKIHSPKTLICGDTNTPWR